MRINDESNLGLGDRHLIHRILFFSLQPVILQRNKSFNRSEFLACFCVWEVGWGGVMQGWVELLTIWACFSIVLCNTSQQRSFYDHPIWFGSLQGAFHFVFKEPQKLIQSNSISLKTYLMGLSKYCISGLLDTELFGDKCNYVQTAALNLKQMKLGS